MPVGGSWYLPTLITGASTSAAVAQTEIFGPVLVAMSFRTPAEAVQLANNTVYGLAACVWTESISLALDVAPPSRPAWCGSTPPTSSTPPAASAATRNRASAAKAAKRACTST
jgi:hypothetical protein